MGNLFDVDGKFVQGFTLVMNAFVLGILWLLLCIPIFTIGASTAALHETVYKNIMKEEGYIFKEFWKAFRREFKQATLIWLAILAMTAFLVVDGYAITQFIQVHPECRMLLFLLTVISAIVIIWVLYVFPCLVRFENTVKNIMKNALFIALINIKQTVLVFLTFVVWAYFTYIFPFTIVFTIVFFVWLQNRILDQVLLKYTKENQEDQEDECK